MTLTLPQNLEERVREHVSTGQFANEADLVCKALEYFFEQEASATWQQQQAALGFSQLDQGQYEELTREEVMEALQKKRRI